MLAEQYLVVVGNDLFAFRVFLAMGAVIYCIFRRRDNLFFFGFGPHS
jgi:hypothetical protein